MILDGGRKHWKDVIEENNELKWAVHTVRWEVYIKEKGGLINRNILVAVPYQKGGNIIWTCVKDNFTKKKIGVQRNCTMCIRL